MRGNRTAAGNSWNVIPERGDAQTGLITRWAKVVCVVALAIALGGLAWICLGSHEPAYQGRPLNAWMEEFNKYLMAGAGSPERARRDQAQAAIRHIGNGALPSLLSMAGAKDSALKTSLITLASKQSLLKFPLHPASYYHAKATWGFDALGSAAKPAVPGLISLLRDKDWQVRASAAQCLAFIGPAAEEAVPALLQVLNEAGDDHGPLLENSMSALSCIHAKAETVVPVLLEYINGSRKSWNYSASAMDALRRYRGEAKAAVPAILPYLNDPDSYRRSSAYATLWAIDPQAAAQVQWK
jgi:hypothetical protein